MSPLPAHTGELAQHGTSTTHSHRLECKPGTRRAIGDALPLLARASSVTVLIVDPQPNIPAGEEPGVEVAMFLLRHGVRLTVDPVQSHGRAIPEVILKYAASHNHDVIVLGSYSHARAREIMLGGVTRSLLAQSPIPLLISTER